MTAASPTQINLNHFSAEVFDPHAYANGLLTHTDISTALARLNLALDGVDREIRTLVPFPPNSPPGHHITASARFIRHVQRPSTHQRNPRRILPVLCAARLTRQSIRSKISPFTENIRELTENLKNTQATVRLLRSVHRHSLLVKRLVSQHPGNPIHAASTLLQLNQLSKELAGITRVDSEIPGLRKSKPIF